MEQEPFSIAYIGTYPPRKCGIGTFTKDVFDSVALAHPDIEQRVVAISDRPEGYEYAPEVEFEIEQGKKSDYRRAAEYLNMTRADIVCIQHEYGIFGGSYGEFLEQTLVHLDVPVITTMHTVLQSPDAIMKKRTQNLIDKSDAIVVLSHRAKEFLNQKYDIEEQKIRVIPHGVPDVPFIDPSYYKDMLNAEGRSVLLTFGLLSPNKGIETVIRALPKVIEKHPQVIYIILGVTHPHILRDEGEQYRIKLQNLVKRLGLTDHVRFINRYVDIEQLTQYIGASDIYITPYLNEEQISSGTLAYAVGSGKVVMSTPYFYATELLADNRGILFPFGDHAQLANQLNEVLDDPVISDRMRKKAYEYGRSMIWPTVGASYFSLFEQVCEGKFKRPAKKSIDIKDFIDIPEIPLKHLRTLMDQTGLIQHARFSIPDRHHGYSMDDSGRALPLLLEQYNETGNAELIGMAKTCMALLYHAQTSSGEFHNFMRYNTTFVDKIGGEDTQGRVLWGLGYAVYAQSTPSVTQLASHMLDRLIEQLSLTYPQAKAYAMCGLYWYLKRFEGASSVERLMEQYAQDILTLFNKESDSHWQWCEPSITYGRAKIPEVLLMAYELFGKKEYKETALRALDFLTDIVMEDTMFVPIGSDGWYPKGGQKARFIQQPIEGWYFIDAYKRAYTMTNNKKYREMMFRCFEWFLGHNIAQQPLGSIGTGSCYDGIMADGINPNKGAESTLAFLYAIQAVAGERLDDD